MKEGLRARGQMEMSPKTLKAAAGGLSNGHLFSKHSIRESLLRSASNKSRQRSVTRIEEKSHSPGRKVGRDSTIPSRRDTLNSITELRRQLKQNIDNFIETTNSSIIAVPTTQSELQERLRIYSKDQVISTTVDFLSFYVREAMRNSTSNKLILRQLKSKLAELNVVDSSERGIPSNQSKLEVAALERSHPEDNLDALIHTFKANMSRANNSTAQKVIKLNGNMPERRLKISHVKAKLSEIPVIHEACSSKIDAKMVHLEERVTTLLEKLDEVRKVYKSQLKIEKVDDCATCLSLGAQVSQLTSLLQSKVESELQMATSLDYEKRKLEQLSKQYGEANQKLNRFSSEVSASVFTGKLESVQSKYLTTKNELKKVQVDLAHRESAYNQLKVELETKLSILIQSNSELRLKLEKLPSEVTKVELAVQTASVQWCDASTETLETNLLGAGLSENKDSRQFQSTQPTSPRFSQIHFQVEAVSNTKNEFSLELFDLRQKVEDKDSSIRDLRAQLAISQDLVRLRTDQLDLEKERSASLIFKAEELTTSMDRTSSELSKFISSASRILPISQIDIIEQHNTDGSNALNPLLFRISTLVSKHASLQADMDSLSTLLDTLNRHLQIEDSSLNSFLKARSDSSSPSKTALQVPMTNSAKIMKIISFSIEKTRASIMSNLENKLVSLTSRLEGIHNMSLEAGTLIQYKKVSKIIPKPVSLSLVPPLTLGEEANMFTLGKLSTGDRMRQHDESLRKTSAHEFVQHSNRNMNKEINFFSRIAEMLGLTRDLMPTPNYAEILAVLETRLITVMHSARSVSRVVNNENDVLEEENRRFRNVIERMEVQFRDSEANTIEKYETELFKLKQEGDMSQRKIDQLAAEVKKLSLQLLRYAEEKDIEVVPAKPILKSTQKLGIASNNEIQEKSTNRLEDRSSRQIQAQQSKSTVKWSEDYFELKSKFIKASSESKSVQCNLIVKQRRCTSCTES